MTGHDALAFDDWFGDSKKKDSSSKKPATPGAVSASSTPPPGGINSPAPRKYHERSTPFQMLIVFFLPFQ